MTAKEYLEQLPDMRLRIQALSRKIAECDDRATQIASSTPDAAPRNNGGASSKIETNVGEKVDLESTLKKIKKEFELFEQRAIIEINKLPDNKQSALLFERYINGLTWERIAEVLEKDVDYTRKELHSKALASFDEIVPPDTRKNPVISL